MCRRDESEGVNCKTLVVGRPHADDVTRRRVWNSSQCVLYCCWYDAVPSTASSVIRQTVSSPPCIQLPTGPVSCLSMMLDNRPNFHSQLSLNLLTVNR